MDPIIGNTPSSLNQLTNRTVTPGMSQASAPKSSNVAADQSEPDQDGDRIDLSTVSQSLGSTMLAPPSGTISSDRLKTVSNRLVTGYYNQPKVSQAVAQGVSADLRA